MLKFFLILVFYTISSNLTYADIVLREHYHICCPQFPFSKVQEFSTYEITLHLSNDTILQHCRVARNLGIIRKHLRRELKHGYICIDNHDLAISTKYVRKIVIRKN